MKIYVTSKKVLIAISLVLTSVMMNAQSELEPVDYVNPLAGTLSKYELSTGNTYPVIARPWGMNFLMIKSIWTWFQPEG